MVGLCLSGSGQCQVRVKSGSCQGFVKPVQVFSSSLRLKQGFQSCSLNLLREAVEVHLEAQPMQPNLNHFHMHEARSAVLPVDLGIDWIYCSH